MQNNGLPLFVTQHQARVRGHHADVAERGVQRVASMTATAAAGTMIYNAFYPPSTTSEMPPTSDPLSFLSAQADEGFIRDVARPAIGLAPELTQEEAEAGFQRDVINPATTSFIPASSFGSSGSSGLSIPTASVRESIPIDPSFVTPAEFQRRQVMPSQEYDSYLERVQSHTASILTRPIINPSLMAIKNGGLLQPSHQPILYRRDGSVGAGSEPMLTNNTGGQTSSVQGREGGQREQYGYLPDYRISHTVGDIGIQ